MNYNKRDIEELTVNEIHSILNSSFLRHYNELKHYEDLSKYATLAIWTTGSDAKVTDLIGEVPDMKEEEKEVERELTESDLEWIEFAKKNNLSYKATSTGVKLNV